MLVRNGIRFVENSTSVYVKWWMGSDCVSVHAQSIFTIPSFLFFPPQVGSLHPQMSHLLICCATQFSACLCVCARACVCLSVSPLNMHSWSQGSFFFFFYLKTRMTACSCVLPRPHRDVPFHVLTLPGPAACWRKSPEESAQMLGWCCVLKRIMINVIWHRRVL